MRLLGMLSAVCITLLLSSATDAMLLSRDLRASNVSEQLPGPIGALSLGFEAKHHHNPLHTLFSRYLYKTTERQNLPVSFLPVSDSIYVNTNLISLLDYRDQEGDVHPRVKQHYESNLIYRFIHSRRSLNLASV